MNMELDKKILSLALKDKKTTMGLANSVNFEYFAPELQWLFNIIFQHFSDQRFKEVPSKNIILEYLNQESDVNVRNNCISLLDEILNIDSNVAEYSWYLDKLRARYNQRIQKECISDINKIFDADIKGREKIEKANKILKETVVGIDSIYKRQIYKEGSLADSAEERLKHYEGVEENPEIARGTLTGLKEFDRITNGLHSGELMIIAGDTGTGKSILMHNIGVNAYLGSNNPYNPLNTIKDDGKNILYFSLEMPKESIERRIDSCMGDLYYMQLRDGALSEEDKERYRQVIKFQMNYKKNFYVVDMPKGATVREIELKYIEVAETKFKPDLVIVDYLGIMSSNSESKKGGEEADWLELGQISGELHEFARVYEVPVITGSQVNRIKEGSKQQHSTSRLARSSMVPNNANVIVQIACRDDEDTRTDMPVYIIKMRDGEKGAFILSKNFAKMKVIDLLEETFASTEENDELL